MGNTRAGMTIKTTRLSVVCERHAWQRALGDPNPLSALAHVSTVQFLRPLQQLAAS